MGVVLVWCGWVPAVSHGAVYPEFGEQTSGGDVITHDCPTGTSGGEPVESCMALADRLTALRWRLGALHDSMRAATAGIGDLQEDANGKLDTLHDDLVTIADATAGGSPELATVELSTIDRATIEDAQGSLHADVWFLAGLLSAFLVASQLRAVFRP